MFITKTKLIIVFTIMTIIGLGSFRIHLYERQDSFRVENFPYSQVNAVKIFGSGISRATPVIISNKSDILEISQILLDSKEVDFDNINVKSSKDTYEIRFYIRNRKNSIMIYYFNTSFSGGIIQSGDYYYKNDRLLSFITNKLISLDHASTLAGKNLEN
jgi:hypothetical protein